MKLLLLSDCHLSSKTPIGRLDDYRATCLRKFEYVLKYAQKIGAIVLQAGDLFDKPRDWFILHDVVQLLQKYKDVRLFTVFGQHDTYMYSAENRAYTAMGVLQEVDLVCVLHEIPTGTDWGREYAPLSMYGVSFSPDAKIPLPPPGRVSVGGFTDTKILVAHSTISDVALYPGQQFYDAKKFLKDHDRYDLILCADIHRQFYVKEGNRHLINTGPMMRREASHYNFAHEPSFYVYDTETRKVSRGKIPCEPAKKVLSRKHIESSVESSAMLETFIQAVRDDNMDIGANLVDNIHAFLKKNKIDKNICDILEEVMSRYEKETL